MSSLERHTRAQCYALARRWLAVARECRALAMAARKRDARANTQVVMVSALVHADEWRAAARALRTPGSDRTEQLAS